MDEETGGAGFAALPEHRFPPARRCIYCGAASAQPDGKGRLTDEHIVPFALNGHLVLPEASCDACQKTIATFETAVLRGGYRPIREWLKMNSRAKGRPKTLPMFIGNGSMTRKVDVPVDIYPVSLLVPWQPIPSLLAERFVPSPAIPPGMWPKLISGDAAALEAMGVPDAASQMLDAFSCLRMIAKIAHSMAVAQFGLGSFEPLLLDCILKGWTPDQEAVVGSLPVIEPPTGLLHKVELSPSGWPVGSEEYLIAKIRLFAVFGAPTFLVVAGRRLAG